MKRNVSVVRFKFRCNILISGKIIKELPSLVASGTPYRTGPYIRPQPLRLMMQLIILTLDSV